MCLENDEYLAYRLDVVDGFVSKAGETGQKVPGLKLQWHLGCKKDENGECMECGHIGESFPGTSIGAFPISDLFVDECTWGCQVKTPEENCFSFWGSGFAKEFNPYNAVSLNITVTTNKDCGDDSLQAFVDRITEEGIREASLTSDMKMQEWFCRTIPEPEEPATAAKKRQEPEPPSPQITDVWVNYVFTGTCPNYPFLAT